MHTAPAKGYGLLLRRWGGPRDNLYPNARNYDAHRGRPGATLKRRSAALDGEPAMSVPGKGLELAGLMSWGAASRANRSHLIDYRIASSMCSISVKICGPSAVTSTFSSSRVVCCSPG